MRGGIRLIIDFDPIVVLMQPIIDKFKNDGDNSLNLNTQDIFIVWLTEFLIQGGIIVYNNVTSNIDQQKFIYNSINSSMTIDVLIYQLVRKIRCIISDVNKNSDMQSKIEIDRYNNIVFNYRYLWC